MPDNPKDEVDKLLSEITSEWQELCILCCTDTGEAYCTKNSCKDLLKFQRKLIKWASQWAKEKGYIPKADAPKYVEIICLDCNGRGWKSRQTPETSGTIDIEGDDTCLTCKGLGTQMVKLKPNQIKERKEGDYAR